MRRIGILLASWTAIALAAVIADWVLVWLTGKAFPGTTMWQGGELIVEKGAAYRNYWRDELIMYTVMLFIIAPLAIFLAEPRQLRGWSDRLHLSRRVNVSCGVVFLFCVLGTLVFFKRAPDPVSSAFGTANLLVILVLVIRWVGRRVVLARLAAQEAMTSRLQTMQGEGKPQAETARGKRRAALAASLSLVRGLVIFAVFLAVAVAIILPNYTHVPPERLAASELILSASGWRTAIAEFAKAGGSLVGSGNPLKSPERHETSRGTVVIVAEPDGRITARNEKFGLEVVLSPALDGQEIKWDCKGTPAKFMPASCR